MSNYGLTADELLLIYITFLARDEEGSHSEFFSQWFNSGGKERLRDLFNSLKTKGIIHKNYNPETYVPNDIEFNLNFIKSWTKNSMELGLELFNAYPISMRIDDRNVPLRDISKRFSSLDDFFFFYSTQIGHNPKKHAEILELLEWGKANNHINFGILNFVISHQWEYLKQLRDNPELVPVVSNICIDE